MPMTVEQRAHQFWSVLVLAARSQQLLSYTLMESLTGVPAQGQSEILGRIAAYCRSINAPSLPSIVIKHTEGLPGHNFPMLAEEGIPEIAIFKQQARVFTYEWLAGKPPASDAFGEQKQKTGFREKKRATRRLGLPD
jgi:hypothetical protein